MARLVARRPATLWGGASYWPVASAGCLPHSFGDGGASASTAPAVVSRQPQQQQQQQQRRCHVGSSGAADVRISERRLKEFLKAEVAFFADQSPNSISLRQVLDASTPERAAELSIKELPIRFAQRIVQIESLECWDSSPELVNVHSLYCRTFRDLRLVELDLQNLEPFTDVIQRIKGRMRAVIPSLATAMRALQQSQKLDEAMIGEWLDTFLLSRIGTEMLTSQYMACITARVGARPGRHGIVDDACDPAGICEQAARHARKLCMQHFKLNQDVVIRVESFDLDGAKQIRFPYVPQYLFYIMVEILKNSARATVEVSKADPIEIKRRPIMITVGADHSQVAIRVHDVAGGIPFSVADRVWSYMYSTSPNSKSGSDFSQQGTPLAGYGVGLPLSRLYARYLGGSLHLQSLPGIGTRNYLYLKRLESEAREAHSVSE
eukprot:CAMPEP_0172814342 /NCGR_PEP_ID=MMETSP1075-20121228/11182_1 /TAXON_ID=2916 /ORGANISM="Ceratium fusus, Strain PA161109" /LENGTH=435 /DNA_ID=CAMNT_0013654131 /DNA_START=127 /DNA_END=1434 /DNA_ORIENTATION=-